MKVLIEFESKDGKVLQIVEEWSNHKLCFFKEKHRFDTEFHTFVNIGSYAKTRQFFNRAVKNIHKIDFSINIKKAFKALIKDSLIADKASQLTVDLINEVISDFSNQNAMVISHSIDNIKKKYKL